MTGIYAQENTAYTAMGVAIQAYEPEATMLLMRSPAALLQVLLEAGRRALAAALPSLSAHCAEAELLSDQAYDYINNDVPVLIAEAVDAERERIRRELMERQAVLAYVATNRHVVAVLIKDVEDVLADGTADSQHPPAARGYDALGKLLDAIEVVVQDHMREDGTEDFSGTIDDPNVNELWITYNQLLHMLIKATDPTTEPEGFRAYPADAPAVPAGRDPGSESVIIFSAPSNQDIPGMERRRAATVDLAAYHDDPEYRAMIDKRGGVPCLACGWNGGNQ